MSSFLQDLPASTKDPAYKKIMYELIINQLKADGFAGAAKVVEEATMTPPGTKFAPEKLADTLLLGIQTEYLKSHDLVIPEKSQMPTNMKLPTLSFTTRFITTHKGSCRCAKFSPDGKYVITGSADCSLKLLDVEKMHFHNQTKAEVEEYAAARPVIRTFYDHQQPINDVDFHPFAQIVASSSKDMTVKFYDYSKATAKRAYKQIQESHNVRSINFHPSGDYMLVGTDHNVVRIYDIATLVCYGSPVPQDHHVSPINQVRWAPDGKLFASAAKDGAIKIWDGVTARCINTIGGAHNGQSYSIQFSKNGRYLLTGGQDMISKLWDITTGRQVRTFKMAPTQVSQPLEHLARSQTTFNFDEEYVVSSDRLDLVLWSTKSGEMVHRLPGHNKQVRWVATSPIDQTIMSCSDDQRARFWVSDQQE